MSCAIFDGNSYFNTGYAPRNTHNLKFEVTYDGGYYCLFGREEGGDINESLCFFEAGAGPGRRDYTIRCGNMIGYETEIGRVGLWSGKMTVNEPLPVKGGKYKVTYAVDSSANRAYFEQYNENTNTTEIKATAILNALADSDLPIYIGWSNRRGGSPDPKYNGTIYNIKFWEDDILLHDYVFRNVNGVGKVYDKVAGQYFDNLGSGSIEVMEDLDVTPEMLTFSSAGGTKTVTVEDDNEWNASTDADWISVGIVNSTIHITASENTGDERRAEVLVEDTEGNRKIVSVKQRGVGGSGHPFYFGGIEIPNLYLGDIQITYAYLGGIEVYANGPYNGLKAIPAALSFSSAALSNTLKIKATDGLNWQITNVPTWLTLSQTEGVGSAEIEVTATELEEETTTTMMLAGGDYSVEIEATFSKRGYIRLNSNAEFTLDFDAGVEYNKNNYLRIELNWDEATDAGFNANGLLYSNNGPWFALDHFHNGTYWCAGSSTLVNEVHNYEYNTNGYQTTFVSVFNNGSLTCDNGDLHRQSSFNGGIGSGKVKLFFNNTYRGDFYEMKIFNTPDGDPVYDFIASKNADGNGCVYDAVNHKQYVNETGNVIPFISI